MTMQATYTAEDWQALRFAPLLTFYTVGYADGKLSPPETAALTNLLGNAAKLTGPREQLAREVLTSVKADFYDLLKQLDATVGAGMTYEEGFARARTVLDEKTPAEQAQAFREAMIILAAQVAQAAPLFGPKVSPEERASVEMIRAALGA